MRPRSGARVGGMIGYAALAIRQGLAVLLPGVHRAAFILMVTGGLTLLTLKRTDEPSIGCAIVDGHAPDYRILVVGESWASGGKLLPELPKAVSERLGGRGVQTCSIGFNGRNSRLLYTELREKFPKEKIESIANGKKLDKVIIMNGVNDEIQHVGASTYVEYTKKLVEYFSDAGDVEVISIPRVNERYFKPPNLYSLIKRTILRCFYDGCDYQINDLYRVALWRDHPELHVIEFDNFIDKFEGHEEYYTLDGVHLTDEYYHKYGAFIGRAMSLSADETHRK
ncbi:SGNH/GDSL hydrolase family protein [Methylocystis sp. ATCC 49242]|uniref:SGNH/GDSL hydrolase family protein n=2 Tax=unclassified Methylocystis TaxID=2625913 RepID=UPI0001F8782E|nr:SGNH/GDSL hydrolase family protein [Methylocystis sp. ATCC 49242]